jgi:hypothetical protein
MLSKLTLLLKSKVAVAVVGAVLVGSTGAVALAATHGKISLPGAATSAHDAEATHTPNPASNGSHAHTVAIEGTLVACSGSAPSSGGTQVICVQDAQGHIHSVTITSQTNIVGDQTLVGKPWSALLGRKVQVQASEQSDGSLVAWKVTIEGAPVGSGTPTPGGGQGQHAVAVGTIATLGQNTFTLTLSGGASQVVTVSSTTVYAGTVHGFSDLKAKMHVTVQGALQSDHSLAATRIIGQ